MSLPISLALSGLATPPLPGLTAGGTAGEFDERPSRVILQEFSAQAHRELSTAILSGVLAAGRVTAGPTAGGKDGKKKDDDEDSAFDSLKSGLKKLGFTLGVFHAVALASPGTMERFKLAIEDTTAVVGQQLAPVFELLRAAVRLVGDVLISILPGGNEVAQALAPVGELLNDLREAIAPLVPIIHGGLLIGLKALGIAINLVLLPFRFLAKLLSAIFGGAEAAPLKTSVGAAAREITFKSPEAYAHEAYQAAFRLGAQPEKLPYDEKLDNILGALNTISKFVHDILELMPNFKAVSEGPQKNIDDLAEGLKKKGLLSDEGGLTDRGRAAIEAKRARDEAAALDPLHTYFGIGPEPVGNPNPPSDIGDWLDQAVRRAIDGHAGGR